MTITDAWSETVRVFVGASERAGSVLNEESAAHRWSDASICTGFTVGGLSAHLLGVLRAFERRIELPTPSLDTTVLDPADGYHVVRLGSVDDLDQPQFRVVRESSQRLAERGHGAIARSYRESLARLAERLAHERPDRLLESPNAEAATTLHSYTVTRIVELVVHADDLAESVGVSVVPADERMAGVVIDFLTRALQARIGTSELIRAFAGRRPSDVLRVL